MKAARHPEGHPGLVLVGSLPPPVDGQSVAFEMLVEGLRRAGIPHEVVDMGRPGSRFARARWARAWDHLAVLPRYLALLRAQPEALVYLTVAQSAPGFLRDVVYGAAAHRGGHRLVLHVHGGNYGGFYASQAPWTQRAIRRFLSWADRIVVLGEGLRSMFDFDPDLRDRIAVVPNGLPVEPSAPVEAKRLPPPGEPFRLLFLSNLVESKGFLELVEAVRILVRERKRDVVCDFCGEFRANPADDVRVRSADHAEALFRAAVERAGIGDRVRYRGVVQGEEKERLLSAAHAFVLPTRYVHEGQPISVIEAMAYGCVVIATRFRGIPELVRDGESGWLLEDAAPEGIATAVESCLADPERFERMSRAALERFQSRYTRSAHLRGMITLFEEVARGSASPPAIAVPRRDAVE